MKHDDTIVAVATAAGVGGIAVVRLSGDAALTLALRHLDVAALAPRHATYCHFDDLDDVVTTYFPRGYSGEPTVEIACHGSRYLQLALVDCLVADGARLAEPGEFTLRAFRHGRLNLAQAEAVADLVEAVTPVQHRLATSQLRGGYAAQLKDLRRQLLDLTSLLELELDFSQEEVEFADRTRLRELLTQLNADITRLTSSFALGNALKQGIPVAIVGAPNVGKSTLLNALLQDDRAIVSEVPGTTRDTIEECLTLDGITFRLVDTAGLRDTADRVERLGIERSRRAQEEAMIVVEVLSPENPENPETPEYPEHPEFPGQTHLTVLNKCDLLSGEVQWGDGEILRLSAKTSEGLDTLKQALVAAAGGARQEEVLLTNSRHREALQHVQEALGQVAAGLEGGVPADLLAVDLRDALYHLGTITGEVANDEVLGNIFARFCIGK